MNNNRRDFIKAGSFLSGSFVLAKPMQQLSKLTKQIVSHEKNQHAITVFHTNDLHGKMNDVYNGLGGINNIATALDKDENYGVVLDAGDFLQGVDRNDHLAMITAMNKAGYQAATIGNNELVNGQSHLADILRYMQFPLVNCNYSFSNTELASLVKPYFILYSGKFKIGITGVGAKVKVDGVGYNDAYISANKIATYLKHAEKCNLVICLAHLGYENEDTIVSNKGLAMQSENIDMVIGGHHKKMMLSPMVLRNKQNNEVFLSQAGWDGLMLGKVVFGFNENKQRQSFSTANVLAGLSAKENVASVYYKLQAMA
jgi:5'-nucleotidase